SIVSPVPLTLRSTLFPYTTLFRSALQVEFPQTFQHEVGRALGVGHTHRHAQVEQVEYLHTRPNVDGVGLHICVPIDDAGSLPARSEEHTSELQSRENLVCRLLLEK